MPSDASKAWVNLCAACMQPSQQCPAVAWYLLILLPAFTDLVNDTDFIVARGPTTAFVTMTGFAQAVQHVCSSLVGVELCRWLGQPAGAAHLCLQVAKLFNTDATLCTAS